MNNKKDEYEEVIIEKQDSNYLVQLSFFPGAISIRWCSKRPYDLIQADVDGILGFPQNVPIGIGDLCLYSLEGSFYVMTPDQETEKEEYNRVKPLVIEWFKKFYAKHKEVFHKEIIAYLEENKEYMEEELANGVPCWDDGE